jgi:hypothetical protein
VISTCIVTSSFAVVFYPFVASLIAIGGSSFVVCIPFACTNCVERKFAPLVPVSKSVGPSFFPYLNAATISSGALVAAVVGPSIVFKYSSSVAGSFSVSMTSVLAV